MSIRKGRSEKDLLQTYRDLHERIGFHGKSPAEKKGAEFDRKLELKNIKKMIKDVEKLNKEHEKFQYNNRSAGEPAKIFRGLQEVESNLYSYMRGVEQGKWDGEVTLED